jgi:cytochrome c oxidase assembly protein subunit 15
MSGFGRYAWATLAYNFGVVVWGAFVRATGSGAGCGEHWPTCNGEVVPRTEDVATMIEFAHRLTSGVALLLTVALVALAVRRFPGGHRVRRAAWATLGFMLAEAALGAGLVLFGLVDDNDSVARAVVMCMHLINTLFLMGFMALTAWWADRPGRLDLAHPTRAKLGVLTGGLLLVGMTGAIAALGDTLFPSTSLAEGFKADIAVGAHFLLRLRTLHPVFALLVAFGLIAFAKPLRDDASLRLLASWVVGLTGLQVAIGFINLGLLAPVYLQLIHLFVADALWVAFILLGAHQLEATRVESVARAPVPSTPSAVRT